MMFEWANGLIPIRLTLWLTPVRNMIMSVLIFPDKGLEGSYMYVPQKHLEPGVTRCMWSHSQSPSHLTSKRSGCLVYQVDEYVVSTPATISEAVQMFDYLRSHTDKQKSEVWAGDTCTCTCKIIKTLMK